MRAIGILAKATEPLRAELDDFASVVRFSSPCSLPGMQRSTAVFSSTSVQAARNANRLEP